MSAAPIRSGRKQGVFLMLVRGCWQQGRVKIARFHERPPPLGKGFDAHGNDCITAREGQNRAGPHLSAASIDNPAVQSQSSAFA
jgi:hypothetical protein